MKGLSTLILAITLLLVTQQTFAVVMPERDYALVDKIWCDMATVGASACDGDAEIGFRPAAMKISKKSHQLKKSYAVKNGLSYANRTTAIFQDIDFYAELLFDVYSGNRAYLLTGGDERGSC